MDTAMQFQVRSAEKKDPEAKAVPPPRVRSQAEVTRLDLRVLGVTGAILFLLSAVFLWQDLAMPPSVLAAAAAVMVAGLSMTRADRKLPLLAPILMVALVLVAGGWYAALRDPILLAPLAVMFLAAVAMVVKTPSEAKEPVEQVRRLVVWYGMVLAAVAASWACYFEFITLRFAAGDEGRRLILTGVWMLAGVGLVVLARWKKLPVARDAGFAFLAAGVGKLVLYDTAHLYGMTRIAGLAAAGGVLLLGAWLTARLAPRTGGLEVRQ